ncbi:MAG: FAD-dependent oxidoreductase [Oscillospiraceae bacterium]|nr:FAD-dependent oxidoreductase [Oscillospiraceae bacterium]
MSEIRLNIDGIEAVGFEGQTILDIAGAHGIEIPTLCHDERVELFASCGICLVEVEGSPKMLRACSTFAANGMVVKTATERVLKNRKAALELLMSDHAGDCVAPCKLACPAQTDCQGYVGLIANGEFGEAVKLIKDKIPLPASIGRVCPHPCEDACRRELVEEPVSIAFLKQFVGDLDMARGELYTTAVAPETGKSIAIVGAGPGGLTAAYFLRAKGHEIAVYDAMPQMGGMLRYGIPEYRLPKKVLDAEIDAIEKMGVKFVGNIKVGRDLTLEYLKNTYDAVIVAVGAWTSTPLGCPGEELDGVFGGIDFLRDVAMNNPVFTGRKVAVVGGGNTAMDACRTAVRLGASEVYNIYRRTRNEMPAQEIEIIEAEEEGVIFKNLTNPIEVLGENGKVKAVRLQIMELGEPDASGRRRPVPVAGKEETIEVDSIMVAIGQKPDLSGFEELEATKWSTIVADQTSFLTSSDGVFAVGDVTNNGADIAIAAIGEAKNCVEMVERYLYGETLTRRQPYLVKDEKTAEDFAHKDKAARVKMPHRSPAIRRKDFLEVNLGLGVKEAKAEGARCLECGCHDFFECKLIALADRFDLDPAKFGIAKSTPKKGDHPFIHPNSDKCILCGLCVRICDEVVGATALGFVDRGFDAKVAPALLTPLQETNCVSCGQCVHACPTGALTETMMIQKQVPLEESLTPTTCSFCSVGCGTKLASKGHLITRSLPAGGRNGLLCAKGRFGFGEIMKKPRLVLPVVKEGDSMKAVSYDNAIVFANKGLQSLQTQYGDDCVAVAISERYTNEEAFLIKEYANKALGTQNVFSLGMVKGGLGDVLDRDASTVTLDEMDNTDLIVVLSPETLFKNHGVATMRIRKAVARGAKLILLASDESLLDNIATLTLDPNGELDLLEEMVKALAESESGKKIAGYDELVASLKGVTVSEGARKAAEMIAKAPRAVFVYEKNFTSAGAGRLVGDMALLSGHNDKPRRGVLQLLPGANSQGLVDLGVKPGSELLAAIAAKEVRGLFIFGEEVTGSGLDGLDFLAVQDLHMTEAAKKADVIFPASTFAETYGSYTGADGQTRPVNPAAPCLIDWDNLAQVKELALHAGFEMPYQTMDELQDVIARAADKTSSGALLMPAGEKSLRRGDYAIANELCVTFKKVMLDLRAAKKA